MATTGKLRPEEESDPADVESQIQKLDAEISFVTDVQHKGVSREAAVAALRERINHAGWIWTSEDERVLESFLAGAADITAVAIRIRRARK